tara:strand:+ start:16885 stop:17133 length:249 start_codon:yes stop_codon:yes gene_type:complete
MNVTELIERLQYVAEVNPDAEVRLASQPNWPFEWSISNVLEVDLGVEDEDGCSSGQEGTIVYIAEGSQLGYLPGVAKDELGW